MKDWRKRVLIVIRSKRQHISTLDAYTIPKGMDCVVLADPSVFAHHCKQFKNADNIHVIGGLEGLGAQAHLAYRVGYDEGYDWVFRMDDDLHNKFFVAKGEPRERFPKLGECIKMAYRGATGLNATLVGFANTSRLDWLGSYIATTYAGIHGAAQLHCTSKNPSKYIDKKLPKFEDVWRACAHRHHEVAARVQFIGMQKAKSSNAQTNQTTVNIGNDRIKKAIKMVNAQWPQYVVCNSTTTIHAGKLTIPHWHFHRAGFVGNRIEP